MFYYQHLYLFTGKNFYLLCKITINKMYNIENKLYLHPNFLK